MHAVTGAAIIIIARYCARFYALRKIPSSKDRVRQLLCVKPTKRKNRNSEIEFRNTDFPKPRKIPCSKDRVRQQVCRKATKQENRSSEIEFQNPDLRKPHSRSPKTRFPDSRSSLHTTPLHPSAHFTLHLLYHILSHFQTP